MTRFLVNRVLIVSARSSVALLRSRFYDERVNVEFASARALRLRIVTRRDARADVFTNRRVLRFISFFLQVMNDVEIRTSRRHLGTVTRRLFNVRHVGMRRIGVLVSNVRSVRVLDRLRIIVFVYLYGE